MEVKPPKLNEILDIGNSIKEYRKLNIAEKSRSISLINEIEFNKKDLESFENIISINKDKLKNITKDEYLPKLK